MPGESPPERMSDAAAVDQIEVALAEGRPSRVEARRRHLRVQHTHGVGQQRVEAARQPECLEGGARGQARDLAEGVDARVATTRPRDLDRLTQDARAGVAHEPLHRGTIRLHLPAREVRAVVGKSQAQGAQGVLSELRAPRSGCR